MSDSASEEQGPTADDIDCTRNEPLQHANKQIEITPNENARPEKPVPKIRSTVEGEESKREKSKKVAAAIVRGNPNIADLSDANRPTKIAEVFSELYDNGWTDAYEELTKTNSLTDNKAIQHLLDIVQFAFKLCTQEAEQQLSDMHRHFQDILTKEDYKSSIVQNKPKTDYTESGNYSVLSHLRKTYGALSIDGLQKKSMGSKGYRSKVEEKYCKTAVKLCWWMCIQDPPVYMCQVDDKEELNPDFYRAYTKSGSQLDYLVWPALRLYKDGPLLCRGVAQFK